ncbi:MAG: hypothetical protein P8R42_05425 [Candidatus Binatia bacterium]|nr:hypothetical protein [Candidatus Binatia bacterium]
MITYAYWAAVFGLTLLALGVLGVRMQAWKPAIAVATLVLVAGWGAYAFHFQQIFVKRWGGVMTLTIPTGERHIGSTWKEDNLWTESYDPETNTCHFREYSKGNLLQGNVTIKDCNPVGM